MRAVASFCSKILGRQGVRPLRGLMEDIQTLLSPTEAQVRSDCMLYECSTSLGPVFVKVPRDSSGLGLELELVTYLNAKDFPTFQVWNAKFAGSEGTLVYSPIPGVDGFHVDRSEQYFHAAGSLVGLFHQQVRENTRWSKTETGQHLVHGDLHSGNIISGDRLYLIDFSSVLIDYPFADLLNLEYEACYEEESLKKRRALLDVYREHCTLSYPDRSTVLQRILDNDGDELARLGPDFSDNEYGRRLAELVSSGKPSFIPLWCTD